MIRVSQLISYPVKSCRGISDTEEVLHKTGPILDRQWMVVNEQGMFVAQREAHGLGVGIRSMCQIETSFTKHMPTSIPGQWPMALRLNAPGMPELLIPVMVRGRPLVECSVRVWRDQCAAYDEGDEAAAWFTEFLSRERPGAYRLVRISDDAQRMAKSGNTLVSFADGYPLLVISQASLDDLNRRLVEQGHECLPMDRFRPNIVLEGCEPYEEDRLDHIRINDVDFFGQTLCVRCPITTTDQVTAQRGKEPLRTLATYRKTAEGVVFGRNFTFGDEGQIHVGDQVDIIR